MVSAVDSPMDEPNRSGLVKTKGYNLISAPDQDKSCFTLKIFGPSVSSTRDADMQEWELTTGEALLQSAPVRPGFPLGDANKVLVHKFS